MGAGKKKSEFNGNFEKFRPKGKKDKVNRKKEKPWRQREK